MSLLWMMLAAAAYVAGGYCMKLAAGLTQLVPSLLVFLFFGIGATCQTWSMRYTQMGVAYILVLGMESVLAAFCSAILLREHWSALRIAAVALVVVGLILLHRTDAP